MQRIPQVEGRIGREGVASERFAQHGLRRDEVPPAAKGYAKIDGVRCDLGLEFYCSAQ
jgi:hypothetical protein